MGITIKRFGPLGACYGIILEDEGMPPAPGTSLELDTPEGPVRFRVLRVKSRMSGGRHLIGLHVDPMPSSEVEAAFDRLLDEFFDEEHADPMEVGLVFDKEGKTIHWHLPPGRDGGFIPDTDSLWDIMWENRHNLGGFAHTHPWKGEAHPSADPDLTTFKAIEDGLGMRILWWVVTFTDAKCFVHLDDDDYTEDQDPPIRVEDIDELRRISKEGA
jgi:hypothetical protein